MVIELETLRMLKIIFIKSKLKASFGIYEIGITWHASSNSFQCGVTISYIPNQEMVGYHEMMAYHEIIEQICHIITAGKTKFSDNTSFGIQFWGAQDEHVL